MPRVNSKDSWKPTHQRRWTIEGRIVYDRPKHNFTEADLRRIAISIKKNSPFGESEAIQKLISNLTDLMLEQLLELVGITGFGDEAGDLIRSIIMRLIDGISAEQFSSIEEKNNLLSIAGYTKQYIA